MNSFQPTKPKVIEEPSKPTKPATTPTNNSNIVSVPKEAYILPNDTYLIRVPDCFKPSNKVVIIPKFKTKSSQELNWIPTVCRVKDSHAVYPNNTNSYLIHPKCAHFQVLPVSEWTLAQARAVKPVEDPFPSSRNENVRRNFGNHQL